MRPMCTSEFIDFQVRPKTHPSLLFCNVPYNNIIFCNSMIRGVWWALRVCVCATRVYNITIVVVFVNSIPICTTLLYHHNRSVHLNLLLGTRTSGPFLDLMARWLVFFFFVFLSLSSDSNSISCSRQFTITIPI